MGLSARPRPAHFVSATPARVSPSRLQSLPVRLPLPRTQVHPRHVANLLANLQQDHAGTRQQFRFASVMQGHSALGQEQLHRQQRALHLTVALVHREMEGSLLAVQLLLAQGAVALHHAGETKLLPSARMILLEIRKEIRNVTGMYLGPRQRQTYWQRLQAARGDARRRRGDKVRRPWPSREPHRPPGAPKILKMGTILKDLMDKTLRIS